MNLVALFIMNFKERDNFFISSSEFYKKVHAS